MRRSIGPVLEWLRDYPPDAPPQSRPAPPLRVLWITPLRALAGDTEAALRAPVEDLGLPWTVESRTGDTPARIRARQRERLPTALVTTPESLSLLLTRDDAAAAVRPPRARGRRRVARAAGLQARACRPSSRWRGFGGSGRSSARSGSPPRWEISTSPVTRCSACDAAGTPRPGRIVRGLVPKALQVDALIPATMERFPWSGQIGLRLLPEVVGAIEEGETALVFTNTRATAEIWYQALLAARPDWAGIMALHHGSMDRATREWVEDGLREGRLRCVVCTSTLDLGVDFTPVDRVLQIGSPKAVGPADPARGAERPPARAPSAGSPASRPTRWSWWTWPPRGRRSRPARIEARRPVERPLDLLAQHAVTVALGGGFRAGRAASTRCARPTPTATSPRRVGLGARLHHPWRRRAPAYPEYSKVVVQDGRYVVTEPDGRHAPSAVRSGPS